MKRKINKKGFVFTITTLLIIAIVVVGISIISLISYFIIEAGLEGDETSEDDEIEDVPEEETEGLPIPLGDSGGSTGGSGTTGGSGGSGGSTTGGGDSCQLTSSFWSVSQASDGDLIYLVVEGDSNCAGETATFEIFDNNAILINTIGSIGLISGRAVTNWTVETGEGGDGDGGNLILPLILEASLVFFAFALGIAKFRDRKMISIMLVILIIIVGVSLIIIYYGPEGIERVGLAPLENYYFVATLDSNSAVVVNSETLLLSEFEFLDLTERTLVVYNENYPDQDNNGVNDALEIAQYYATQRGIDSSGLCGVQLATGQYGSADELLGARKTIVEQCICSNVLGLEACDMNNNTFLDTIIEQSPITHMVIIRGIPARLTETGWTDGCFGCGAGGQDGEKPSLDFYLSYLIYSNDSIFEGTSGFVGSVVPSSYKPSGDFFGGYLGPLSVQDHRFVAYGRVEAMTKERTFDLIDRTLVAEQNGFTGNLLSEQILEHNLFTSLSGDFDSVCTDYLSHEPFVFGDPASSWPYQQCRAGTTDSTSEGSRPKQIPGEVGTVIPFAINAGVFLGTHFGDDDHPGLMNLHHAFDGFNNMLNWHKSEEGCIELCRDCDGTNGCTESECVIASTDYFKEINTDCVGVAPGFMAFQLRSWPVQFYGFVPNGWKQIATGAIDKTMPVILQGGAFTNADFTDDKYAHFGTYGVNNPGPPTCTLEDGSQVSCPERIGIHLIRMINIPGPLIVDGIRQFRVVIRHRNPQNPVDAKFPLRLRIFNEDLGVDRFMTVTIPMSDAHSTWYASEWVFTVNTSVSGFEDYTQITKLQLWMQVKLDRNITGFFDMDGIEVIDMETGDNLFDIDAGSFNILQTENTVGGDWPANVIDRLGGIASWGSSSHHLTLGFAFRDTLKFVRAFYSGRTLGESLVYVDKAYSGIIYGDPLYSPSAVKIFSEDSIDIWGGGAGFLLWKDTLDDTDLFINVLHGNNNSNNTQWALEKCGNTDLTLCHVDGLWTPWQEGTKARYEKEVNAFAFDFIDDLDVSKDFAVKLRVWNSGEEEDELNSYAFVKYVAQDFAFCPTDLNGDGIVDSEDRILIIRQCTDQDLEYDFNGDSAVDSTDLQILLENWGDCPQEGECPWDINGDGTVGNSDLLILSSIIPCTSEVLPNEYDINLDGIIDNEDKFIVQLTFGMCDTDGDGTLGGEDNCPVDYNPEQEDNDEDGIGDVCDICPDSIYNDLDGDGLCEGVDPDDDGDGILDDGDNSGNNGDNPCTGGNAENCDDNCPITPNGPLGGTCVGGIGFGISCSSYDDVQCNPGFCSLGQEDSDGDGIGDVCDF